MNGSKSGSLIMQMHNFERQGKFVLAFKPALDTRDDTIKSRAIKEGKFAHSISNEEVGKMTYLVEANLHKGISRIFVDEFQFFTPELVKELAQISISYGIDIYAYSLLLSYTGKIFDSIVKAIEVGFSLEEIKMQCDLCENKATHHLLKSNGAIVKGDEAEIHIGDQEYLSTCYKCFIEAYSK